MKLGLSLTMVVFATLVLVAAQTLVAAPPTADQALRLAPIQDGIDYAKPAPADVAKCKISVQKAGNQVGWVVEDANGMVLRKFIDTNGDNVVDQWCYYKDGIEVYRDIDSDFNGKADQYRWFNTAGTRWGIDKNEDGKVDSWKAISAEEATAEIVAALAERNADRFALVALSRDEISGLGLGKEKADRLTEKVANLVKDFKALATQQKAVAAGTQWSHFSGGRPGLVPAGTDGSTRDLRVYENVVAIVEAAGKNGQVPIGTLVQVGDTWRAIDLPQVGDNATQTASTGFFFQGSAAPRAGMAAGGPSEETQKLLEEVQELDRQIAQSRTPSDRAKLVTTKADKLETLADQAKDAAERAVWIRQLADMLSAEVQQFAYQDGTKRLAALFEKLQKSDADRDLAAHVKMLKLMADYTAAMAAKNPNWPQIQTEWLKDLESFIKDFPKSADAAEAMLQLAMSSEFNGQEEAAGKWYARIVKDFPDLPPAQKAAGAQKRLDSMGKVIALSGKSPSGSAVDVAKYRGKVVLIHYWATWSQPAKNDLAALGDLLKKYGNGLAIVGVNLDTSAKDLNAFLTSAKVSWPQIWEEGGLDSRPANQLGILTVPTMILIDQQGRVVNRSVQADELEAELKKLIR